MIEKHWTVALALAFALCLACSSEDPHGGDDRAEEPDTAAPSVGLTADLGDAGGAAPQGDGSLPEGHPPVGGQDELNWKTPEGWVEETPSSSMRKAQYRVAGEKGAAECVVFYFGPGQGGEANANLRRWAGQFTQPDGRSSEEVATSSTENVGGRTVYRIEVTGTYQNLMVSENSFPGYMLLGAIVEGPDANWFFKLTGPESTVRAQREAFDGLIGSVR